MSENVPSDLYAQRRFRSACAYAKSDQNFHGAHFGQQRVQGFLYGQRSLCSGGPDAQAGLNFRWAHMSEGTFSHVYFSREIKYSRTSMARAYLGPWKFVRNMGSSSH